MHNTDDEHEDEMTPEDMADLDKQFREDNIDDLEGVPVPDGRYVVRVDRTEVTPSRSGKDVLLWEMISLGPTHKGRKIVRFNSWATEKGRRWTKRDLHVAGVHPEKFTAYETWVGELLGVVLEVRVRTTDRGTNVHIIRRVEAPPDTSDSSDGELPTF